jgi:type I restriction enzyme S subunit
VTNWINYKLSDLMQIKYGKDHKHLADGTYPLYGSGGIMRYVEKPLYNSESILIPRKGTLGNLFYLNEPFWSVDTMFYSCIKEELVLPKYLFYTLKTCDLASLNVGSAVPSLTTNVLNEVLLSIPPLPTQKAIAEILSSVDDKIELNNQINQNLEALAQALFKQWFVDFEFPNENGDPYKSSGGEMIDSELGEIPKGWKVVALSEIIELNPTEKLEKGKIASYLDMSSLPTSGSFPDLPIQREFTSGMKFKNGDTLFARITPCLENGKTAFVQFLKENEVGWGSTEFIVLRPKSNWPKEFGYLIARNEAFRSFAIQNLVGTSGRQRVSSSILENFQIVIPQEGQIITQFGSNVFNFFEVIKSNSFENNFLKELRNTLLPKLISGKLEVNESLLEPTF